MTNTIPEGTIKNPTKEQVKEILEKNKYLLVYDTLNFEEYDIKEPYDMYEQKRRPVSINTYVIGIDEQRQAHNFAAGYSDLIKEGVWSTYYILDKDMKTVYSSIFSCSDEDGVEAGDGIQNEEDAKNWAKYAEQVQNKIGFEFYQEETECPENWKKGKFEDGSEINPEDYEY